MKITLTFYVVLIVVLTGCAAKELVVRNADTMLEYQINKRLPLYSKQEDRLSRDIDAFLNKEKKVAEDILPVIDKLNFDRPEEMPSHYAQLEEFYRKLSLDFTVLLTNYMVELDDKQKIEFFETLGEENKNAGKKTQDERREDAEERLEKFIGDLTSEQKKILRSYDDYYKDAHEQRLKNRIGLHEELKRILNGPETTQQKKTSLLNSFQKYQEENFKRARALEILQKLIPTLKPKQKELLRLRAKEIKEILRYFIQVNY